MSLANVLLVDDEVEFVETFSERLGLRDVAISKAFNGEEALQVLESNKSIEIVILDVKMPGMDGIETLTEIKKKHPLVVFSDQRGMVPVSVGIAAIGIIQGKIILSVGSSVVSVGADSQVLFPITEKDSSRSLDIDPIAGFQ